MAWNGVWSLRMDSADHARRTIRDAAKFCYFVAAILVVVAFALGTSALVDAGLILFLGLWLHKRKSKFAAGLLLLMSAFGIYATGMNWLGLSTGGKNIVLSIMMFWVALRATIACVNLPRLEQAENPTPVVT